MLNSTVLELNQIWFTFIIWLPIHFPDLSHIGIVLAINKSKSLQTKWYWSVMPLYFQLINMTEFYHIEFMKWLKIVNFRWKPPSFSSFRLRNLTYRFLIQKVWKICRRDSVTFFSFFGWLNHAHSILLVY